MDDVTLCDEAIESGQELDPESWNLLYMRPDGWWLAGYGWETEGAALADGFDQFPAHTTWTAVRGSNGWVDEDCPR